MWNGWVVCFRPSSNGCAGDHPHPPVKRLWLRASECGPPLAPLSVEQGLPHTRFGGWEGGQNARRTTIHMYVIEKQLLWNYSPQTHNKDGLLGLMAV